MMKSSRTGPFRPATVLSAALVLLTAFALSPSTAAGQPSLEEALKLLERSRIKDASLTLSIGFVAGAVGSRVEVPVTVASEGTGPTVVVLFVNFDPTKLAFVTATLGAAAPDGKELAIATGEGEVSLIVYGLDRNPIGNGILLVLEFDVLDITPTDVISLTGANASAATIDAVGFSVTVEDGQVNLGCPAVAAPANVLASDGEAGGVTVAWDAVAGAAEYRVHRSAQNNSGTAIPLGDGWQTEISFLDETAPPPSPPLFSGCLGSGQPVPNVFYYWVKARTAGGCEGPFSASDSGYRGEDPAKVFEKALPVPDPGDSIRWVDEDGSLFLRLRSSEAIDPGTVWGEVVDARGIHSGVTWLPVDPDDPGDGWVVYAPANPWTPGDFVTMTAGAETADGALEPVTADFLVVSDGSKGDAAVQPVDGLGPEFNDGVTLSLAAAAPALEGAVGPAYELEPGQVFDPPRQVWLPVPAGIDADAVAPYYYFTGETGAGWKKGEDVEGWLVPGSYAVLEMGGATYFGLGVRHAGVVQLAVAQTRPAPVGASVNLLPGTGGDTVLLLTALAILAILGPVAGRRRA